MMKEQDSQKQSAAELARLIERVNAGARVWPIVSMDRVEQPRNRAEYTDLEKMLMRALEMRTLQMREQRAVIVDCLMREVLRVCKRYGENASPSENYKTLADDLAWLAIRARAK